jgi:hypothetical protein
LVGKLSHAVRAILKMPAAQAPRQNLTLRISPTHAGKRQLAHIRLFNAGPGPIFIESWWAQWGPNGRQSGHNSVSAVKGKLPLRLAEQDAGVLLVEIGDNLEELSGIGVFDGTGYLWLVTEQPLEIFKHQAIAHRLPAMSADDTQPAPLESCRVEIVARVGKARSGSRDRLEVLFKNLSDMPVPIVKAQLSWTYTSPRQMAPPQKRKPTASEVGGSVSLSPQSRSNPVDPGQEVLFVLDDDMSACLVELLRDDVQDQDISLDFVTPTGKGWKATMDEIPSVVKAVAHTVLKSLHT